MNTQNNTPQAQNVKKPSTRASIAGGVLSILALLSSGIAHLLTHSEDRSTTTVTTAVGTTKDSPVADAAGNAVTGILSMPFSILAIFLALLALLFTALRFGKAKGAGLFWTLVWIGLSIWAISVAVGAISLLKADPA